MQYKNKVTGQIIQTTGVVTGADWELVGKDKPPRDKDKPPKKGAGSKQEERDAE